MPAVVGPHQTHRGFSGARLGDQAVNSVLNWLVVDLLGVAPCAHKAAAVTALIAQLQSPSRVRALVSSIGGRCAGPTQGRTSSRSRGALVLPARRS